jgi:RNA polymerase sigma-70 factor, ECF subfamily
MESSVLAASARLEDTLEQHRRELTGYCYRMLGSPFEAEDAVQETLLRAWRSHDRFEGRSALRSWLYRIATNVCLDSLRGSSRRALPMDLGPASAPEPTNLATRPEASWIEPIPQSMLAGEDSDPERHAVEQESVRLAFITALQHLPGRQRAVLILCEVLHWKAGEVATLLQTSVAAVNSALQRARATLQATQASALDAEPRLDPAREALLQRYMAAFEAYDINALTSIIRQDALQSMPPYELWLQGRDDIFAWWLGPGIDCRGSRMLRAPMANGAAAFGQYRISQSGSGHDPWALQVIELGQGGIARLTFFLSTERLFPLFGLPDHLD